MMHHPKSNPTALSTAAKVVRKDNCVYFLMRRSLAFSSARCMLATVSRAATVAAMSYGPDTLSLASVASVLGCPAVGLSSAEPLAPEDPAAPTGHGKQDLDYSHQQHVSQTADYSSAAHQSASKRVIGSTPVRTGATSSGHSDILIQSLTQCRKERLRPTSRHGKGIDYSSVIVWMSC
jgi:hypothetical protein